VYSRIVLRGFDTLVQNETMARKPTLSPTKITTYLACPSKYRWTYVDDRGKWYLRAKSYYSFGSTLHRVLERFHDAGDRGVTTTDEALKAYEESWIDAGFSSAEEMAEAFGEGQHILERHIEEHRKMERPGRTLFVEKTLTRDLGEFRLMGRVDRIDEFDDGTLEIVDYKSGRESVTEDDVSGDIAIACYQFLLRSMYPDRPIRAAIVAVRTGARATTAMTEEEYLEFERDLTLLGNEILSVDYDCLTPQRKPLCDRCDFLSLCRKHPEFSDG
jgi:putative RecB family exonuclease